MAIVAGVAHLGYPVARITYLKKGFPCGIPFLSAGIYDCALMTLPPPSAAYVYLKGTYKVAAVTIVAGDDEPAASKVVALRVPPASFVP